MPTPTHATLLRHAFFEAESSLISTTQVGCVVTSGWRIAGGCNVETETGIIHAEDRAVAAAFNQPIQEAALTWSPCKACAELLIRHGVRTMICWNAPEHPKWQADIEEGLAALKAAEVEVIRLGTPDDPMRPIRFRGELLRPQSTTVQEWINRHALGREH